MGNVSNGASISVKNERMSFGKLKMKVKIKEKIYMYSCAHTYARKASKSTKPNGNISFVFTKKTMFVRKTFRVKRKKR